jgi:hypothetical protein
MHVLAACVVVLAGCDRVFGLGDLAPPPIDGSDPSTIDADLGMLLDAGPCAMPSRVHGRNGLSNAGLFSVCADVGLGTLMLMGMLDTDNDARCLEVQQDTTQSSNVCMVRAQTIQVPGTLIARGQRPLVLIAETITINATINVSSGQGGAPGAGANWPGCGSPVPGRFAIFGGGGGAGGSFGTKGGNGGLSADSEGAAAKSATSPDRVRGGCAGGGGGGAGASLPGGAGGASGGAIYIIADTLTLNSAAVINASGAGGSGGAPIGQFAANRGGGGGGAGGSGGLIGLDAQSITIISGSRLIANGGGGGGAGGDITPGGNGSEPSPGSVHTAAQGGTGSATGGAGGAGATSVSAQAGEQSMSGGGGGGGGGGAGSIRVFSPMVPTMPGSVSPPWQAN